MSRRLKMGLAIAFGGICASDAYAQTICVDPGGPRDITGCGVEEGALMLGIANNLTKYLETAGFSVVQTRKNSSRMTESTRVSLCSGSAATVSIVANSYSSSSASGVEVYHNGKGKAAALGNAIISYAGQDLSLNKRQSQFSEAHELLNQSSNAALKAYLGFITNCSKDVPAMKNATAYAKSLCRAISATYGGNVQGCADTGKLTAQVTSSTGTAIQGAKVLLVHLGSQKTGTTDYSGTANFTLVGGDYYVSVTASGFMSSQQTCSVSAGSSSTCRFTLDAQSGSMYGKVVNAGTGQGVGAEALMSISPEVPFSFDGLNWSATAAPGKYTIVVTHPQYNTSSTTCTITSGGNTSCPTISMEPKRGSLSGRISCNGADFPVKVTVQGHEPINYNSGKWSLTDLDAGKYSVTATPLTPNGDCTGATKHCQVVAGGDRDCSFDLPTRPKDPGSISGKVVDSYSNDAVAAEISGSGGELVSAVSDVVTGMYHITDVAEGQYNLVAKADGYYESEALPCNVMEKTETKGCDFVLNRKPGTICVTVSADTKFVSAKVTFTGRDDSFVREYTSGQLCVDDLVGKYTIQVESNSVNDVFEPQSKVQEAPKNGRVGCAFEVELKETQEYWLKGSVRSSLNPDMTVESEIKIDGSGSATYDGKADWYYAVDESGIYTVTAVPKAKDSFRPQQLQCAANSDCMIVVNPILPDVDIPIEDEQTRDEATLDIISYGDACQAMPRGSSRHQAWWIVLCGGGLAWFYRRRRAL